MARLLSVLLMLLIGNWRSLALRQTPDPTVFPAVVDDVVAILVMQFLPKTTKSLRLLSLLGCFTASVLALPVFAAKTDTVVLLNGNHVTGEIKSLEFGKLEYSTDSMGTVMIEWDEIQRIESKLSFTVETRAGERYFGAMPQSSEDGSLVMRGRLGSRNVSMAEVVKIEHIEDDFFDRIDTTFTTGYSYSKASDVTDFNFGLEMVHRNAVGNSTFGVSSLITDDGEDNTKFNQISLIHQRYRPAKRYWIGLVGAEQNDELGLNYRLFAGGGIGKNFLQTNLQQFSSDIGLVVVQSESKDGSSATDLEGLWRSTYRIFDYDTPETSLSTSLQVFPGITNAGEYRVDYDITLRKEIVEDFFWDLSFFSRYESDTPDEDASNTDYGITTSFGLEL